MGRELSLLSTVSYAYVGSSTSANNDIFDPRIRPAYSLIDARIALHWHDRELAIVGKNLPNEHADLADSRSIFAEDPGRPRIVTNQPRTIGLEFRWNL